MELNIDKDKMPPNSETDRAPENSDTATMEKSDPTSRKAADSSRHTDVNFFQMWMTTLILYTLIHIALLQPLSSLLGRQFLIPFFFMVVLGYSAQENLQQLRLEYEMVIAAMRLGFDNAIKNSDATVKDVLEGSQAMNDLAQASIDTIYEFQKASQESREASVQSEANRQKDILVLRKQTNEMRLAYFQVYFSLYKTLIDLIEQIVKKVKTMAAQPKVKGTKRHSANRNDHHDNALTGPLERVAAELKQRQLKTKKQITVEEKIGAILEREGLLPKEIDRLVQEAEGNLQHSQDASLLQPLPPGSRTSKTGASPSPLGENMDEKLEKHYEDLDKWFQSVQDRPVIEDEN